MPDAPLLKKRRSLPERAKSEPEAEWRRFFLEVHNKRTLAGKQAKAAAKAEPEALKKFLAEEFREFRPAKNKTSSKLADDLEWLRAAWPKLVGADVGEETEVFAFKNGVVTIAVYDHALLQEIRQFHKSTILQDLRDIWQASVPLVDIAYRVGVKKE